LGSSLDLVVFMTKVETNSLHDLLYETGGTVNY